MAARRLGQIFVDLGYINDDQLEMLVEEQAQSQGGKLIGRIAMEMGLVTDDELIASLGEQFNLQTIDLDGVTPPEDARKALSDSMAQLYRVIPLQLNDNVLTLATCDPQNLAMQDELRRFLGFDIRLLVASEALILKLIDKYFNDESESIEKIIEELQADDELKAASMALTGDGPINLGDMTELANSAPVSYTHLTLPTKA